MDKIYVDLPDGVKTIDVDINVYGDTYKIPACEVRQEAGKTPRYRITHKTLIHIFRYMCDRHQGLRMESGLIDGQFIGKATPAYCCAGCRISNGDVHRDTFYGETKVQFQSQEAEKNNPFVTSVNRAQDKAILDFLGLESQTFFEDGKPALYADVDDSSVDDLAVEHPEKNPAGSAEPAKTQEDAAKSQMEAAAAVVLGTGASVPEPLTKAEEQELLASGKQTVKYRMNGEDQESPIAETSETVLHYFAKSTEEAYAPARNVVLSYLALRAKKAAYSQYMLEQKEKKEGEQHAGNV